mgnify:CR=1 FL=1
MTRFARPIPGQSLTDTPRNVPWEQPPEMVEVGDVVDHYIKRLANDEVMDDMAATFEMGADLNTVVNTLVTTGSMKGLHTVQAGMLAAPTLAAFIKAAMSTYGLDVKESAVSPKEARQQRTEQRLQRMIKQKLENADGTMEQTEEIAPAPREAPVEPQPQPEEVVQEAAPSIGLMARE